MINLFGADTNPGSFTLAGSNGFALSGAATPSVGSDYAFISATGGTFTYGGDLALTFSGTAVNGASYNRFDINGATLGGSSFANVSIGGSDTAIWTGTTSGVTFTFTEATRDLTVSAVPEPFVPEPFTRAAIFGAVGLGFAASRRRRRS